MQNQISPAILSFNVTDPVAATGLFADLASFSAMSCHGLPIVTAVLTGDTSQVDHVLAMEAELVDDQARTVLEDIPVTAIKVGQVGSLENVSVIAEIVSDYPDFPLVLDPFDTQVNEHLEQAEDLSTAIQELLIPQASVLLISNVELRRLTENWDETSADDNPQAAVMHLIDSGCQYVLLTGAEHSSTDITNILFDANGIVRTDVWRRIPGQFAGAGATLSAALTALLARGMEVPQAVFEAQEFTHAALSQSQQLGMGRRIPDRYFWAKEAEQ